MTASPARPAHAGRADRCPGVLRPHRAVDGALVRLRLPGGRISADALRAVGDAAVRHADGQVQLTSRGNLQLRGVAADALGEAPDALVEAITDAGLLPSATHELVRNITCSPLTGLIGGQADLRALVRDLDEMICRTTALASLPGRFLFALDDGRGDVRSQTHDLGIQAVGPGHAALTIAGRTGPVVELCNAVTVLCGLAVEFLRARGTGPSAAWHIAELPDAGAELLDRLLPQVSAGPEPARVQSAPLQSALLPEIGLVQQDDGRYLLLLDVPLGSLTRDQIGAVVVTAREVGGGELIVTPWRTLVLPDLNASDTELGRRISWLAHMALTIDRHSGWHGISACAGAPGCASAAAPTRPLATKLAARPASRPVHVVACERRCGSPAGDHVEVLLRDGALPTVTRRRPASDPEPAPDPGLIDPDTDLLTTVTRARNAP